MTDNKLVDNYKDKILNSRCICKKGINWVRDTIIMLEPCEHIVHKKCYDNLNSTICPLCNTTVKTTYDEKSLKSFKKTNNKFYQKYVDFLSIKNCDNMSHINTALLVKNFPDFMSVIGTAPFITNHTESINIIKDIFCLTNMKLTVNGMENINKHQKYVFIANHTTYLDSIVIYYALRCSFLASITTMKSWIGSKLQHILPIVYVDRGKDINTVDKLKKYIKKHNSVCLFPEGIMSHPDTIMRFRTGAFHVGYPICPLVIKYEPYIHDVSPINFIKKIISQEEISVTITILQVELPPFSPEKIENIRNKMGKAGNMALSRVSNRDIKDDDDS
jgi:1-acyl-sn-glycerol-3-phosphate acyltransferase